MHIKRSPQFILVLGTLTIAGVFLTARAMAADQKDRDAKSRPEDKRSHDKSAQSHPDDETLRRYDRNANGKLDPDEDAAMKADQEKAKRKRKG